MKNFQLIMIVVFMAAAILGILAFAGLIPLGGNSNNEKLQGSLVLWGTVKFDQVSSALEDFNRANPDLIIKYVQKYPETFDRDLLEAFANGNGPDLFLIPDDLAYHYSNKIFTIPFQTYPLVNFKNNFVGAGNVFLNSKGVTALPIMVDPLVMYYNVSMFESNNIIYPPSDWEALLGMVDKLNKKDETGKLLKSAVALGHFSNVSHAKEILSALIMQAGNPIVQEKNGGYISTLGNKIGKYDLDSTLGFYTNFADPLNGAYSWNKSFPNSIDAFSSEKLAIYFGFASELSVIADKNPNLNFMVAPIPQIKNSDSKITFGRTTGLAISSFSKNFDNAYIVANTLANGNFASKLSSLSKVVPARKNLLQAPAENPYSQIFYNSALFAKNWMDPSPDDTSKIFQSMTEAVLSNLMNTQEALINANGKINLLLVPKQ